MTPEQSLRIAAHLAQGGVAAAEGRPVDAARHAVDALLIAVPTEVARQLITDADVRRANEIAEAAHVEKFGPR